MKKFLIACIALFAIEAKADDHTILLEQVEALLWDIRNELVSDIRAGRDTVIDREMTALCVDADGEVIDGEHITIIFRTESVFEQQVLRFAFAYGSWAAGFADSIDIDDSEIVGCRLEEGFIEIPEFDEELTISSK